MFKILLSPYSRDLRNGKPNPKNYPYFHDVVQALKALPIHLTQVGVDGEKPIHGVDLVLKNRSLKELEQLISGCTTWIAVDNFFPHLCNLLKKPGVVLFGQSDPSIFGYPQNTNLLKDRKYLREKQFDQWEAAEFTEEVFVPAVEVISAVGKLMAQCPSSPLPILP